jgi:hypothetical protein
VIDQQLDHFRVPLHASHMQRRVAEITCFVYVDAGVYESLGGPKVIPSHNTMKSIVAVNATSIDLREIHILKIRGRMQLVE